MYHFVENNGGQGEDVGRRFLLQIVDFLTYISNKGVCHRDLKLENILVDKNMTIKIVDFGLAAAENTNRLTDQCGTQSYVAPEIKEGKQYNGAKADIFSAGVLLFVLVKVSFPFVEASW